jgi:hypothetical protein
VLTAIAAAAAGGLAAFSGAQTLTEADVADRATVLVSTLEENGGCDLSLHGAPRVDDITGRWFMAYSGIGAACDDMSAALQRAGLAMNVAFFRRPNAEELSALVGRMQAAVRRGFHCLIVSKGEPRFDADASVWLVRYYASGDQCNDASAELERQGRELGVLFGRVR